VLSLHLHHQTGNGVTRTQRWPITILMWDALTFEEYWYARVRYRVPPLFLTARISLGFPHWATARHLSRFTHGSFSVNRVYRSLFCLTQNGFAYMVREVMSWLCIDLRFFTQDDLFAAQSAGVHVGP
jgi:hypothetical protein